MSGRRSLLVFALSSALAVACGAAVLALGGSPVSTWVRNPLAWIVGALVALLVARLSGRQHCAAVIAIGLTALAATFAAAPVEGVHRWLDLGPLHINAAALVIPAMLAALAGVERLAVRLAVVAAAGAILVIQPDASQAIAFAGGSAVLIVAGRGSSLEKLAGALLCAGIALAGWLRPDSLQPVPEVEGIFALAATASTGLAALAAAALALACAGPLLATRDGAGSNDGLLALATYFALCALAPLLGAFPVPLVGLGMSFPVGWWLGFAIALPRAKGRAGPGCSKRN